MKDFKKKLILGRFEEAILTSLIRLKEAASASDIRKDLERNLKDDISIGVLYSTLNRLENKALLCSREQPPSGKPGGRGKNLFQITEQGIANVKQTKQYTESIWKDIPSKNQSLTA